MNTKEAAQQAILDAENGWHDQYTTSRPRKRMTRNEQGDCVFTSQHDVEEVILRAFEHAATQRADITKRVDDIDADLRKIDVLLNDSFDPDRILELRERRANLTGEREGILKASAWYNCGWRPIEEARKDGTMYRVAFRISHKDGTETVVGGHAHWSSDFSAWLNSEEIEPDIDDDEAPAIIIPFAFHEVLKLPE
jgi:hypothetical protein